MNTASWPDAIFSRHRRWSMTREPMPLKSFEAEFLGGPSIRDFGTSCRSNYFGLISPSHGVVVSGRGHEQSIKSLSWSGTRFGEAVNVCQVGSAHTPSWRTIQVQVRGATRIAAPP